MNSWIFVSFESKLFLWAVKVSLMSASTSLVFFLNSFFFTNKILNAIKHIQFLDSCNNAYSTINLQIHLFIRWILQFVQESALLPDLQSCIRAVRVCMQTCELGWSQVHCLRMAFPLLAVLGSVKLCLAPNVLWHWQSLLYLILVSISFLQSPLKATALWRDRGLSEQCHCTPDLYYSEADISFEESSKKKKKKELLQKK